MLQSFFSHFLYFGVLFPAACKTCEDDYTVADVGVDKSNLNLITMCILSPSLIFLHCFRGFFFMVYASVNANVNKTKIRIQRFTQLQTNVS